jgi:hypothetical protein
MLSATQTPENMPIYGGSNQQLYIRAKRVIQIQLLMSMSTALGQSIIKIRNSKLELELIQTQMAQKPMLRAEVGMRVRCANKASAE